MRRLFILPALLAFSGCQSTQFQSEKTVLQGQKISVENFTSLNPDCSPIGEATVLVTRPPASGRVTSYKSKGFVHYNSNNLRSRCNTIRVPVTTVDYTPNSGFSGRDSFDVEVIFGSGGRRTKTFTINVR
jgi:hypothetical protein